MRDGYLDVDRALLARSDARGGDDRAVGAPQEEEAACAS